MKFFAYYNSFVRATFVAILAISSFSMQAQSEREKIDLEMAARDFFMDYQFHKALPLYQQLDSLDPENPNYIYPLGICYLNQKSNLSVRYLDKCLEKEELYPIALHFYAGKAQHFVHRFDDAIKHFTNYLLHLKTLPKRPKEVQRKITETEREIEVCLNARVLLNNPLEIDIVNLSEEINSPYPEYGPILSADESTLIFTSERPNTTGGHVFGQDGYYNEDIYISNKQGDRWSEPTNIGNTINTAGQDAGVNLSPDGRYLLIYHYNNEEMLKSHSGDLYYSVLEGEDWSSPQKFPKTINSKHWESSGALSADDRTLYFTSNRKGGQGGTDIYVSHKQYDGTWSEAENLGPEINTPFDEESPYIHPDGKTLYFCSTGHNTMGGYDIFVSKLDDSTHTWTKPENIGYPINTAHDDIYFSWSANGKRVYFSSIREDSKGDEDIYYADMEHMETAAVLLKSGVVTDFETGLPIKATIEIIDNRSHDIIGTYYSNSKTGKYTFILAAGGDYSIHFMSDDHVDYEYHVSHVSAGQFVTLENDVALKPFH